MVQHPTRSPASAKPLQARPVAAQLRHRKGRSTKPAKGDPSGETIKQHAVGGRAGETPIGLLARQLCEALDEHARCDDLSARASTRRDELQCAKQSQLHVDLVQLENSLDEAKLHSSDHYDALADALSFAKPEGVEDVLPLALVLRSTLSEMFDSEMADGERNRLERKAYRLIDSIMFGMAADMPWSKLQEVASLASAAGAPLPTHWRDALYFATVRAKKLEVDAVRLPDDEATGVSVHAGQPPEGGAGHLKRGTPPP